MPALPGHVVCDPRRDQWFTPPDVAARLAELAAPLEGLHVLEPSCGSGSLVRAALDAGAAYVEALEIDPEWAWETHSRLSPIETYAGRWTTWGGVDFLMIRPTADLVIMNPPYAKGVDIAHVRHALECAPVVVALLRLAALPRLLGLGRLRALRVCRTRPRFSGARGSPRHEFCAVSLAREGQPGPVDVGGWP